MRSKLAGALAVVVGVAVLVLVPIGTANALTDEECGELVAEGVQARADLQQLIEATAGDPDGADTSDPAVASYVADLLEKAAINTFGFVGASAGQPLELCLPEGTTKLTMFSDPVVLWEGPPATAAMPVTVTIPTDTECGEHRLNATGDGVDENVTFTVGGDCVEAAAASGGVSGGVSGLLPQTGAEIGRAVVISIALITIGFSLLRGRRTRIAHG